MTTKQELESQAAKLRAELEQLDTKIAAMPDDTLERPWEPNLRAKYWYLTPEGKPRYDEMGWIDCDADRQRLAQGNVFPTKKEAERRAALIRLMQPKCARPKKREMGWGITVVGLGASYCTRYDASPGDVALWETGLWFPESQRAEAEAHAKSLNDFFSQEPTR